MVTTVEDGPAPWEKHRYRRYIPPQSPFSNQYPPNPASCRTADIIGLDSVIDTTRGIDLI